MTQSDVLWAARVWKRRMYRCCNGSSLSPQDMHCLHWKSLEARSCFHVSHYLQGLILFDTMEEDGRCFPESECFPCMHTSYLSAMAQRWCCSISVCWDEGGVCASLHSLMSKAFRDLRRCRQHRECVQEDHVWGCTLARDSGRQNPKSYSGHDNVFVEEFMLKRWLRSLEQPGYFENHERHPWWLGSLGDWKTSSSDACGDTLNQSRMWCGSAFPWQMCLGLFWGEFGEIWFWSDTAVCGCNKTKYVNVEGI